MPRKKAKKTVDKKTSKITIELDFDGAKAVNIIGEYYNDNSLRGKYQKTRGCSYPLIML